MPSSTSILAALLALTPLALSLPQQATQSGQGINPINGLAIPAASTASEDSSDSSAPSLTALTQPSPSSPSNSDDESPTTTITASATFASPTDSSLPSDASDTEPPNTDTNVVIWTDTAENTVYTVTRASSTSSIAIPTMQVPPNEGDVATATITGMDGRPTPTHDVDTFVQGYTGGSPRVAVVGGEAKVWWLLGAAAAVGAIVL